MKQLALIDDVGMNKISLKTFLEKYSEEFVLDEDYVHDELNLALIKKDSHQLDRTLYLGRQFGYSPSSASVLGKLLVKKWHNNHEDIALQLQEMIGSDATEELYQCALLSANNEFENRQWDEAYSLARKCIWALFVIRSEEAIKKLKKLTEIDNEIVRQIAKKKLNDLPKE